VWKVGSSESSKEVEDKLVALEANPSFISGPRYSGTHEVRTRD